MASAGGQVPRRSAGKSSSAPVVVTIPVACRVHSASAEVPTMAGAESMRRVRAPVSSGPPRVTRSRTPPPVPGRTRGASKVSSATRPQPAAAPAWAAMSSRAAPGTTVVPQTVWSASQGWVRVESRPVRTTPSPSGSSTAAASSGWPGSRRPAAGRSTAGGGASSQ